MWAVHGLCCVYSASFQERAKMDGDFSLQHHALLTSYSIFSLCPIELTKRKSATSTGIRYVDIGEALHGLEAVRERLCPVPN